MKKIVLLTAVFVFSFMVLNAQNVISNGAFENWTITSFDNPDNWYSSNKEQGRGFKAITVTKVTGRSGFAIKLETKIEGSDTLFGYFSSTNGDPVAGEGGVPYSQKPDSITGYYKSDVKNGDSALLLVIFKKNGAIVSFDVNQITGTQTSFTRFSFPLSLTVIPDTIIIAGASSNGVSGIGVQAGSSITFDDLAFVGTGITQSITNGNFDNWAVDSYDEINNWEREGSGVSRTTDKYKGDYAVLIETVDNDNDNTYPSAITNGHFDDNVGPVGGVPYTGTQDTLVFYYKYIPSGNDTGAVSISLTKNGNPVGGMLKTLAAAASYTKVELPFQAGITPDSIRIVFTSSNFSMQSASLGSKLYIDEVQLKSQPLNTGIFKAVKNNFTVYPNPASVFVTIKFENPLQSAQVIVSDVLGKQVSNFTAYNADEILLPVEQLEKGVYIYQVISDGAVTAKGKFYKK